MQLKPASPATDLRRRLRAAACVLLASAPASKAAAQASNQLDASALLYGERDRTAVVEPTVRVTRLWESGQSLSAQFILDAMTGASPTGAAPATVQTTTSASGGGSAARFPTAKFNDLRNAFDLEWSRPVGILTFATGGHYSREQDYRSIGAGERLSLEIMQRLTTLTVGADYSSDEVDPIGGTRIPFTDGVQRVGDSNSKRVVAGLAGVSRVVTRRWLLGVTGSRTEERGYLTEPYKVVSLLDDLGEPVDQVTENRPRLRRRNAVEGSSAYHLERDVLYSSYRYYWDDWGVTSHTLDVKYRSDLPSEIWVQPHLRVYTQTAADFFTHGLPAAAPFPTYASADHRLGPLRSATVGGTVGFHVPRSPGEFSVRVEYMHQWGKGDRPSGEGGEEEDDGGPAPHPIVAPLDVGTIVLGWSVGF